MKDVNVNIDFVAFIYCLTIFQVNSIVYILDEKSDVLYADKEKIYAAPSKGIIRYVFLTNRMIELSLFKYNTICVRI